MSEVHSAPDWRSRSKRGAPVSLRRYTHVPLNRPPAACGRLRVEASSAPADHDHLARLLMLGPGHGPGEVELIEDVRAR